MRQRKLCKTIRLPLSGSAIEAVVNDDTVRRQSRRATESQRDPRRPDENETEINGFAQYKIYDNAPAVRYRVLEKTKTGKPDRKISVLLNVSQTHRGLSTFPFPLSLAKRWSSFVVATY